MLSTFLEARLTRYAIAAGAVVAAIPTQAAPITVILPNPVFVFTNNLELDIDGDGNRDLGIFSGAGTITGLGLVGFGASGSMALALPTGFQFSSAFSSPGFWRSGGVGLQFNTSTSTSPTFLAVGFSQTIGGFQRLAFLQFEGNALYGYAWEAGASSLTTFDLRSKAEIPEPATGALAALALGALAVAARKRKQA
jgi:hypothetical protein